MKKKLLISALFILFAVIGAWAAKSPVLELHITGGGTQLSASVKRAMEENAVKLLTMMSDAQVAGSKSLNFSGIAISPTAKTAILQMWKYQPMRVWDDDGVPPSVYEDLLRIPSINIYQIRNIPVRVFPVETLGKDKYSEVSINFSPTGRIEDFNISIGKSQFGKLIEGAYEVQDKENRYMIAYWMDQLKTAYETKDVAYLNSLFDKDATIITGVRTTQRTGIEMKFASKEKFEYYVQNREQYMAKLKNVFSKNRYIKVSFLDQKYKCNSDVVVLNKDGDEMPRYYMVWCTQDWNATRYQDKGRLFVLWDFKNPDQPTILVRAWTHPDDPKQFDFDDFLLTEDNY